MAVREGYYFGAGPAALPTDVVEQAAREFVEYEEQGVGLGELSHRSAQAAKVVADAKAQIRELLHVPDNYDVVFLQGGGTGGFAACLYAEAAYKFHTTGKADAKGSYIVTGVWSSKALAESKRLGFAAEVLAQPPKYVEVPDVSAASVDGDFVYYCDNETVHGVEFPGAATTPPVRSANVCVDVSSNMFSRPIDVSKFAIVFGGAQKNLGIPGVTLYIVRRDILDAQAAVDVAALRAAGVPIAPSCLDLALASKNDSCYNTLPIFAVEVIKLVTAKLLARGGLRAQTEESARKAAALYDAIDARSDILVTSVKPAARSRMSVVFNFRDPADEQAFLKQAAQRKLRGLKGHRSVGGIRVSNYNAITEDAAAAVAQFIREFRREDAQESTPAVAPVGAAA